MPMKIEAAAVTQKRPSAEFNNDSVNINGKVFSREIIKNGYKGSGVVSGDVYFALASSGVDGFADAAVAAFNDNAADFRNNAPENVLVDFFDNCREALQRTEHESSELVCSNLYASGRKVVIALNGNAAVYKCADNSCVRVSDTNVNDSGVHTRVFPDVDPGDIFILVSPGVTSALSDKDIDDICKVSDGSVKRIVNLISKVALSKDGTEAGSAIAVKILETALDTEEVAPVLVPDFSEVIPEDGTDTVSSTEDDSDMKIFAADKTAETKDEYTEMIDEFEEADAAANGTPEEYEDDVVEEETASGLKGKILIAVAALIALVVVCVVVVFVVRGFGNNEETTTLEESTTEESTTEEETTEEETTEEETTEETTAETTTRRQQTVVPPTTQPSTTQAPVTEPTTAAPPVTEPTTAAPPVTEPTTAAPPVTEPTTAAPPETQAPVETPSETPATSPADQPEEPAA